MTKQETRTARDDGDGGPSKRDLYAALGTDADPALTLRDEARLRGRLKRAKPSDLPKLAREIETARGRYAERKAAVQAMGGQGAGGKPDFAQGGAPDGSKAEDGLAAVRAALAG